MTSQLTTAATPTPVTGVTTTKVRISQKLLKQMPATIAAEIRRLQTEHSTIKSVRITVRPAPYKHYFAEGEEYTFIRNNQVASIEMVAEHTIGAREVSYKIGAELEMPVGTTILTVYYAGIDGYQLCLTNIGEPVLPSA